MKLRFDFDGNLADRISVTLKGMLTDPGNILVSLAGAGIFQVFTHRADMALNLAFAWFLSLITMSLIGMIKHSKEGTFSAKEFFEKTATLSVVGIVTILLGYIIALLLIATTKLTKDAIENKSAVPDTALYPIFAGYALIITYYLLKTIEMIDYIFPTLLPKWFASGLRKFRETGKVKDMIAGIGDDEKEE